MNDEAFERFMLDVDFRVDEYGNIYDDETCPLYVYPDETCPLYVYELRDPRYA